MLKNYIEKLLFEIADELNVKKVILNWKDRSSTYSFSTTDRNIGSLDENWEIWSLFYSGDIISDMRKTRDYISKGRNQRSNKGMNVRQPLNSVTILI
jgi:hypothetical protein